MNARLPTTEPMITAVSVPAWRGVANAMRTFFSAPTDALAMPGMRDFEQAADSVMSRQATQRAQQIVRITLAVVAVLLGKRPADS